MQAGEGLTAIDVAVVFASAFGDAAQPAANVLADLAEQIIDAALETPVVDDGEGNQMPKAWHPASLLNPLQGRWCDAGKGSDIGAGQSGGLSRDRQIQGKKCSHKLCDYSNNHLSLPNLTNHHSHPGVTA